MTDTIWHDFVKRWMADDQSVPAELAALNDRDWADFERYAKKIGSRSTSVEKLVAAARKARG